MTELSGPGALTDGDVRLTPSQVESFTKCGLRWLIEAAAGASSPSVLRHLGTVIHAAAVLAADGADDTDITKRIDEIWHHLDFGSAWYSSKQRAQAGQMVRRFLDWHRSNPREVVAVEQDLHVRVGRVEITGRVDRLERDDDGSAIIVDLKTGSSKPPDTELDRNPQLGVYQLAVLLGAFEALGLDRARRRRAGSGRQGRPGHPGQGAAAAVAGPGSGPGLGAGTGRHGRGRDVRLRLRGEGESWLPGLPGGGLLSGARARRAGVPVTGSQPGRRQPGRAWCRRRGAAWRVQPGVVPPGVVPPGAVPPGGRRLAGAPGARPVRAGAARPPARRRRADRGAVRGHRGDTGPDGGDRRGGFRQERDDGGPARLAGRERHGAAGAGTRPHVHPEGGSRARAAGPGPAGRPAQRRPGSQDCRARPGAGRRSPWRPGDLHLPRLRGAAGRRSRAARGARAVAAADHPGRLPGSSRPGWSRPTTGRWTRSAGLPRPSPPRCSTFPASWPSTCARPADVAVRGGVAGQPTRRAAQAVQRWRARSSNASEPASSCFRWWPPTPRPRPPGRSSTTATRWRWPPGSPSTTRRSARPSGPAIRSCCSTSTRTPATRSWCCCEALFGGGHPVTAVGDPCQSIYGWRGASAGNLRRFAADFPPRGGGPAPVRQLSTSFRNTGRVLDAAAALQQGLRAAAPEVPRLVAPPGRAGRGAVACALLETAAGEAQWVAGQVARLLSLPPGTAPDGGAWPDGRADAVRPVRHCRAVPQAGPVPRPARRDRGPRHPGRGGRARRPAHRARGAGRRRDAPGDARPGRGRRAGQAADRAALADRAAGPGRARPPVPGAGQAGAEAGPAAGGSGGCPGARRAVPGGDRLHRGSRQPGRGAGRSRRPGGLLGRRVQPGSPRWPRSCGRCAAMRRGRCPNWSARSSARSGSISR